MSIPVDALAMSVAVRFLLFEHPPMGFLRDAVGKLFFFAPNYWKRLSKCPYCNGFWVFVIVGCVLHPDSFLLIPVWGVVASWLNYFCQLLINILEFHPANKVNYEQ